MVAEPESGCCRVACFSERHDLRLATMDDAGVAHASSASTNTRGARAVLGDLAI
jgi:hypothetical protein